MIKLGHDLGSFVAGAMDWFLKIGSWFKGLFGDGDFDLLLHKIRTDFGVSAEVYGVTGLTAISLVNSASKFVPIEDNLLLKTK